jgi:hypothetical protein
VDHGVGNAGQSRQGVGLVEVAFDLRDAECGQLRVAARTSASTCQRNTSPATRGA